MLQLHSFGQHADSRFQIFRKASNGKQKLMLLGFDARLAGRVFAETKETADLVPQFRHRFEVR
jgi:hypothetical protein